MCKWIKFSHIFVLYVCFVALQCSDCSFLTFLFLISVFVCRIRLFSFSSQNGFSLHYPATSDAAFVTVDARLESDDVSRLPQSNRAAL